MGKDTAALSIVQRFIELDAQQAAIALEALPPGDAAAVIGDLQISQAARCLERVRPHVAAAALERLLPEPGVSMLLAMGPDHVADIFRSLPDEARKKALDGLTPGLRQEVLDILTYPDDSAGRIMRTGVLAFPKEMKVQEVIQRLRSTGGSRASSYAYVVGAEQRLVGVLNMRDLLLADPGDTSEKIMREVISVPAFTDREELIHIARTKPYVAIPVTDAQGRLIGVVKNEDILESSEQEATEDLQMMFGASAEERASSPLRFKIGRRLPWLTVNLGTAFAAGAVVALYEGLIGRVAVLAVFLPIVAGQGGNAGIQSLAVVLRGLVTKEVRTRDAMRLLSGEAIVGAINGIAIGAVTALGAWLWKGNPYLGLVVGLAMIVNMLVAGVAGAGIPIVMKRLGFDPAQSSGIFVTTVTDMVGFFSFLGLATLFQSFLI